MAAYGIPAVGALSIACATAVVYVAAGSWLLAGIALRSRLTRATMLRIALLLGLSYVLGKLLGHVIIDPRPYLVEHIRPLTPVASDNGFPSDHVLLVSAFAASAWWLDRRLLPPFAAATGLVIFGRLAVAAHHTWDVAGSVLIVCAVVLVVRALPRAEHAARRLIRGSRQ